MHLKSLGYRTDLIFIAFDGVITDRGNYLVVCSPRNPTFYWGNFLLFSRPPGEGDFEKWRDLFVREIGAPPDYEHQTFGWDSPSGEVGLVEPFQKVGFEVDRGVVLTAAHPRPPEKPASDVSIRALTSAAEWEQAFELQVLCRGAGHDEAGYREYRRRATDRYRGMEAARLGHWYGAFSGDRLVADLGIFHDGRGLGRYQSVETHPDFRRQGIAGTMVYEAGWQAIAEHGLETLVIIGEDESSASRLYQSVGFLPTEKTAGMVWYPHAEEQPRTA